MQHPIVAGLAPDFLKISTADSDRFVHVNYFQPLLLERYYEIVPPRPDIKLQIKDFVQRHGFARLKELVTAGKLEGLLAHGGVAWPPPDRGELDSGTPPVVVDEEDLQREIADLRAIMSAGRMREEPEIVAREIVARAGRVARTLHAASSGSAAMADGYGRLPPEEAAYLAGWLGQTRTAQEPNVERLVALLQSQIGVLFLDRTRIRPAGFAIGEHLYALSLAPGEDVTFEQKTFSKREVSFEEQNEEELQLDLELSSTLTTELDQGLERQDSLTNTTGWTADAGADGTAAGYPVKADVGYSNTVVDANSTSGKRSAKDAVTTTSKLASKYRAAHRTTFRVASEDRFESTSRRVIKNPSRYTPMQLHYFKVLRRIELSRERYGARLAWAPCVKDPAFDFFWRLSEGKEAIKKAELEGVAVPEPPTPPAKADKPAKEVLGPTKEADKWGLTGDMRADYELQVSVPKDYVWDGDPEYVKANVSVTRQNDRGGWGWRVVGEPWTGGTDQGSTVHVKVHVGSRQNVGGKITMQAKIRCIPDPNIADPDYQAAWKQYLSDSSQWQAEKNALIQNAVKAGKEKADQWERDTLRQLQPVQELINAVLADHFPPSTRNDCWEIELWQQLFDWDNACLRLFPSWWSDLPIRDSTKAADDFVNASFAKVYIPVRVGMERLALRWIFLHTVQTPGDEAFERGSKKLVDQIEQFRQDHLGGADETFFEVGEDGTVIEEKFITLARWTDLLPTDGTHLEVVQGATTALDSVSAAEVEAAGKFQAAVLASQEQDAALKKAAAAQITKPPTVQVSIATSSTGQATADEA